MKGNLQLGGGDGYTTMGMYLASLDCALKVVNLANLCIFYHTWKKNFFKGIPFRKMGRTFSTFKSPYLKISSGIRIMTYGCRK